MTVHLEASNVEASDSDYTFAGNPIIIPAGSLTGFATITGVADGLDEPDESLTVSIVSVTNATQDGEQQVIVTISDGDNAPLVTLSADPLTLTENGGTSTVTATLSAVSTLDVTVDLAFGGTAVDPTDYTVSAGQIIIAAGDTTGSVTVTAVDNDLTDGDRTVVVSISGVSNGTEDGEQSVTLQITDDEATGVTVSPTAITVAEGGDGVRIDVVLDVQPTGDVTITVEVDNGYVTVDPATLTFTPDNWDTPQTVTITAVDNFVADGLRTSTISHTVTSGDDRYDGLNVDNVTVDVGDNDVAGVDTSTSSVSVTEGGEGDSYSIVLSSQPTADVQITVTPDGQVDLGHGAGVGVMLTFTDANWNSPQIVEVAAVDDGVEEGDHIGTITHSATSADARYDGIAIVNVTVNITDNE